MKGQRPASLRLSAGMRLCTSPLHRYNSGAMFQKLLALGERPYTDADAEWDEFVARHPHGSLLQTTNWARLKGRFGWTGYRVWLRQEGQLIAGAQILFRSAAWGLVRMAYIPHGPLVNWQDGEQVAVLFNQVDQAVYQHRASLLKMEPRLWQDEVSADSWHTLCRENGCLPDAVTIQPPHTILIDLRASEEEILGGMKPKTRYNIGLAARKGITVRTGAREDVIAFTQLMHVTGQRNAFGVHDPAYYQAAFDLFAPEQAALILAAYEGQPLAGVMVFRHGDQAAYLYGASSNIERERMPSYAAQWAGIQWAKSQGCTSYDLWGIPDAPLETLEAEFTQRQEGLWGVYRFKRGFGGMLRRTVGAVDRPYNNLVYRLYQRRNRRGSDL